MSPVLNPFSFICAEARIQSMYRRHLLREQTACLVLITRESATILKYFPNRGLLSVVSRLGLIFSEHDFLIAILTEDLSGQNQLQPFFRRYGGRGRSVAQLFSSDILMSGRYLSSGLLQVASLER